MNSTAPNVDDLLMGGGPKVPALKVGPGKITDPIPHSQPGEFKGGRIVDGPEAFPVMKRDRQGNLTSEQDTYPSGDPIWGVVVTLQTNERDPGVEGDDGKRRFYIDGPMGGEDRKYDSRRRAVRTAVEAVGATGLQKGGDLYVAWTERVDVGTAIPATNWVARYTSPANNLVMGQPAAPAVPAQAAPVQPVAQVQGGQANPFAGLAPEQIAALAALQQVQQGQQQAPPF